jgi:hypothetical protein
MIPYFEEVNLAGLEGRQARVIKDLLGRLPLNIHYEVKEFSLERSNVNPRLLYLKAETALKEPDGEVSYLLSRELYLFTVGPRGALRQLHGRFNFAKREKLGGKK